MRQHIWMVLDRGQVSVCVQHPGFDTDVVVTTTTRALSEVFNGLDTWARAVASEAITVTGPPSLVRALPRWFQWSPFASATAERARRAGWSPGDLPALPA